MRTVGSLLSLDGQIFVFFRSRNIFNLFLKHAEQDGFTFQDGTKPTDCSQMDLIALHDDWTLNHVGWAGHMLFRNPAALLGETPLIRVDYGKYLAGREDYII